MQAIAQANAHSPFLAQLLMRHEAVGTGFCQNGPEAVLQDIRAEYDLRFAEAVSREALMEALRTAKAKVALLVALADLAGEWTWMQVTAALSDFACHALQACVRHLLQAAVQRGEIAPFADMHIPQKESGLIVLGMGKLGGRELNYSSDIDLIIFFEPGRIEYRGRQNQQQFFSRLAQDLVTLMQERTRDGYVFRTDLRLRPDPASTPPAITVDAALYYYESVGQNWERAALIKARPVAGDLDAGERFLKQLVPFLWRKHLDFAAIQDIQSIKRQMDSRNAKDISVPGHNVKIGLGGIREIEFYTQIHQLIWGGRKPNLRIRPTCETLALLVQEGLVEPQAHETLTAAYAFLRMVEHRLQMVDDQQTHTLPQDTEKLHQIARFCGFSDYAAFETQTLYHLRAVHEIFASSFRSERALGDEGNLVFTGVSPDPETVETLRGMSYREPERVAEIIMGWHHGSHRCTRTKRARELLTELMPAILRALASTSNPDAAFQKFDEFLKGVPTGIQLFSLFSQNPQLLKLIADIMGSAPILAETLGHYPQLMDMVLYGNFYQALPAREVMAAELAQMLEPVEELEWRMDALRRFKKEKQFQAGVQLLKGTISGEQNGAFLSDLAEVCLSQTLADVQGEFERSYGRIKNASFCVLALGKLGSRELAFESDIDLVFVYDVDDFEALSDGAKSFTASVYYNRMVQRLLNALTSLSREGLLYEVDTRLRPSGKQGLLAVSRKAFRHYFTELAWTFEFMALVRARAVAGDAALGAELEADIAQQLCRQRDTQTLITDVLDMRQKVAQEYPPGNPWDVKHERGGLMDIDFIAQALLLSHAHAHPELLARASGDILQRLHAAGLLTPAAWQALDEANQFLLQLQQLMRLSAGTEMNEDDALPGLKTLLAMGLKVADFETLKKRLLELEESVRHHYLLLLGEEPTHHS